MVCSFFNGLIAVNFIRYYRLIIGASPWLETSLLVCILIASALGILISSLNIPGQKLAPVLLSIAGIYLLMLTLQLSELPMFIMNFHGQARLWKIPFLLLYTYFPVCLCLGTVFACRLRAAEKTLTDHNPWYVFAHYLLGIACGWLFAGLIAIPFGNLFCSHTIYNIFIISAFVLSCSGIIACGSIFLGKRRFLFLTGTGFAIAIPLFICSLKNKSSWDEAILTAGLNSLTDEEISKLPPISDLALKVVYYREGLNSVVSVVENSQLNTISIKTDGQTEATLHLNPALSAPTSDEQTQKTLGILPSLLCMPKNVFLLGYGAGITANAVLNTPGVISLTAAEIEPNVFAASQYLHMLQNKNSTEPPMDKRLQLAFWDGRCYLSMAEKNYDLIICQAGEPWRNNCGHLYTVEFWQLVKKRLTKNGLTCQWLPLYGLEKNQMLRLCQTFSFVFPEHFL